MPYALHEDSCTLDNVRFNSGETLGNVRLHYRSLGQPQRDAHGVVRNAVLILHGTGGSGESFLRPQFADVLFGPDQLLDAEHHYIILPDNIGHGQSSKPSDGLRARFPHYGYEDMVALQHRLLTEHLGVNHLRLVMGTSMGGMHTWLWGIHHPHFMEALLPLASLPVQIGGRNRMIRRMILDAIRNDPAWQDGEYAAQPPGLINAIHMLLIMVSSPLQWQRQAPTRDGADEFLHEMIDQYSQQFDANDMLYYFDAARDYNPQPHLEQIVAPLVAINSADDQVNPPELGILEREITRLRRGRAIVLPITEQTRGHGTHSHPLLWQAYLAELLTDI
ncbi:MAG: alpha/beta fold hydrolase [Caldilineaceae bacterium]|nr:alpha/beta fold hydrolase [Caldilineaceae bacterium]